MVSFFSLVLAACRALIAKNKIYALVLLYFAIGLCLKVVVEIDCLPPCLISFATGIECWGCGLTRASIAVIKFDFASAFEHNPLIFFVLPSIALVILYALSKEMRRLSKQNDS